MLEQWRNESPAVNTPFFRWIVKSFASRFDLDSTLAALIPRERLFATPIETRSQAQPDCFRDTYRRLLEARESLLPWLLMATYSDHPPSFVEAYRFLRLGDIQKLLDKMASVLADGASRIDRVDHWDLYEYIPDREKQLNFLLDLLPQYGIEADTYAEAVQQYVHLLDTIFPANVRAASPSGNGVSLSISASVKSEW
jgi:hypothetical protein